MNPLANIPTFRNNMTIETYCGLRHECRLRIRDLKKNPPEGLTDFERELLIDRYAKQATDLTNCIFYYRQFIKS